MKESVQVSVWCITYNHKRYIRRALDSMVAQKTRFAYEVIVHDDASTDGTAEIVAEYAQKYPEKIIPVLEKENQVSQGKNITMDCFPKMARGKYFALCEGDDYWIDDFKLQKQYDYMEKHPNCTFCVHNAIVVNTQGKFLRDYITSQKSCKISCRKVVRGGGGFCVTNSIFAPTRLLKNAPEYINESCMDYILQTYLASQGKSYCFQDKMSAYRIGDAGSWTERMKQNAGEYWKTLEKLERKMAEFDAYTNGRYHDEIQVSNMIRRANQLEIEGRRQELFRPEYMKIWMGRKFPLRRKLSILRKMARQIITQSIARTQGGGR